MIFIKVFNNNRCGTIENVKGQSYPQIGIGGCDIRDEKNEVSMNDDIEVIPNVIHL